MEIYKIVAFGLICAFTIVYLKSTDSTLAMPLTVCSGVILLTMTASYLADFLDIFKTLTSSTYLDGHVIKLAIKILAISYLVEFSASTIEATYIVEPRPKMVANENKKAIIPCLVSMNSLDLKHIRISLSTTNNTIL